MPTPPSTTKAPSVIVVESVVSFIFVMPVTSSVPPNTALPVAPAIVTSASVSPNLKSPVAPI